MTQNEMNDCQNCGNHIGWSCKVKDGCGENHENWKPIQPEPQKEPETCEDTRQLMRVRITELERIKSFNAELIQQREECQKELAEEKQKFLGVMCSLDTLSKELAEKNEEIKRLKSQNTFHVANNLCRCCGKIMADDESKTHDCGKEQILGA